MSRSDPSPRPLGLAPELAWSVRVGAGGPTRGQARGRAWRRTSHGLYVPAAAAETVEQRIVEAAAVLPAYGAVTGWAALRWLGGRWFDGADAAGRPPVTLALMDSSVRAQPGVAISEERLDPTEIQPYAGIRVTLATYALLFEIRHCLPVRGSGGGVRRHGGVRRPRQRPSPPTTCLSRHWSR